MPRTQCWFLAVVAVLLLVAPARYGVAEDCDAWSTIGFPEHDGCNALMITPCPTTGPATVWRHHEAVFSRTGEDVDTDCHRLASCTEYTDVDEDTFTYSWALQVETTPNVWETVCGLAGTGTEATWSTTASYEPEMYYRAVCWVDDTSGDGPGGDDIPEMSASGHVFLCPNFIHHLRFQQGCPSEETYGMKVYVEWDGSCAPDEERHLDHLDKVAFRELVEWDGAGDPHDCGHGGANCFNKWEPNPGIQIVAGTAGLFDDVYLFWGWAPNQPKPSLCYCTQKLQYACFWGDTAPAEYVWRDFPWECTVTAKIEDGGNVWYNRITRVGSGYPGEYTASMPPIAKQP